MGLYNVDELDLSRHGTVCLQYVIICDVYNLGKAVCEQHYRSSCQMRTCNSLICAPMHKEGPE